MYVPYSILSSPAGSNVTVFIPGGDVLATTGDHPNFAAIVALLEADKGQVDNVEDLTALFDIGKAVEQRFQRLSERVTVENGVVYFDGDQVENTLVDQIVRFLDAGEDFAPLLSFWDNIASNPSPNSVQQLYDWVAAREGVTITPEGMIVGYKGVKSDGKGGYESLNSGTAFVNDVKITGRIPNSVGDTVSMPRSEVMDDPHAACHRGLHVGTYEYAQSYSSGGVMLRVIVNPRDVVSVPYDASGEKIRVCRYTVDEIITEAYKGVVYRGDEPEPDFGGFEIDDEIIDADGDEGVIVEGPNYNGEFTVRYEQFDGTEMDWSPEDLKLA